MTVMITYGERVSIGATTFHCRLAVGLASAADERMEFPFSVATKTDSLLILKDLNALPFCCSGANSLDNWQRCITAPRRSAMVQKMRSSLTSVSWFKA